MGAVIAIPTPGTRWVPIPIKDNKEEMESDSGDLKETADRMKGGERGREEDEDPHPS